MSAEAYSNMEEAAADWVARMDRGDWCAADEAALQDWLAQDPRHRGVLLQAQAIWSMADAPPLATMARPARASLYNISRRRMLAGGGAALAASIAGFLFFAQGASYTTNVGEVRRVVMADGSAATINTQTRVDVDLAERSRNVRLANGEAWFQVAKDKTRPFIVEAGRIRVQAIGTAFSVRRRDAGADILVTEGIVRVWAEGAEGSAISLSAGQGAYIADNVEIRRRRSDPAAIDRALAWRGGKIELAGNRLSEAVSEFNRYNRRQIIILDPIIGAERFDGVFGANDVSDFVIGVRDSLGVPVDLSDPDVVTIGSAPR